MLAQMQASLPDMLEIAKSAAEDMDDPVDPRFCSALRRRNGKRCTHLLNRQPAYVCIGSQRWPVYPTHAKHVPSAVVNADSTTTAVLQTLAT